MISSKKITFPIIHSIYNSLFKLLASLHINMWVHFKTCHSNCYTRWLGIWTWGMNLRFNPKTIKQFKYEKISPNKEYTTTIWRKHIRKSITNDVVNSGSRKQNTTLAWVQNFFFYFGCQLIQLYLLHSLQTLTGHQSEVKIKKWQQ